EVDVQSGFGTPGRSVWRDAGGGLPAPGVRQSPYTGSKRSPSDSGLEGASRPNKRDRAGPAHRGFSGAGDGEKWDAMKDVVYTPSKKPNLSGAEMLSPDALETSLIASYDAGSDAGMLPTFSPYSQ
ncbi:unnamed protein product, partial [Laminaria digitata]